MLTFASWYESSWNFIIVINYVQKHWRKSKLQNYETTSMFVLSSYVSFSLAVLWGFYRLDYGSGRVLYGRKKQLTCSSNATNSNADKERNRSIEKSTTLLDQWKVSMKRQSINVDRFGLKYIKVFLTSAPKSDSPRTMMRVCECQQELCTINCSKSGPVWVFITNSTFLQIPNHFLGRKNVCCTTKI